MTAPAPFFPASNQATRLARRHAFTLVELLSVIAIIGILAAIIIPVAGKARAGARKTQCASNLRQIYTVIKLYANDNKGALPLTIDRTTNKNWWETGSPLAAYAQGILTLQRLSVCPENETSQPVPGTDSYGKWVKNEYGYSYVSNYQTMPDGTAGIKINQIGNPTKVILMADSAREADWGPGLYFSATESAHLSRIGLQHGPKANALWVDGHVTFSDKTEIKDHCLIQ